MDFDDHDDGDDDMALPPVASGYDRPVVNSGGPAATAREKLSGGGGAAASTARYRECQKNHAVSLGAHAVDGCGEFMAAGEEGTIDALRCAACNCHRNFHRKETEGGGGDVQLPPPYHLQFSPYYRTPAGYMHHHMAARPPPPLALPSTSGGGGHSRDEGDEMSDPAAAAYGGGASGSGKKRFRTKFTQEQKDKMLAFAERVGWRIQKQDEAAVQLFCQEACVKRHVLKVWMHNNKHTLGKKP